MRGMCSTVLFFEAIIVALAAPVMIGVEKVDAALALWVGLGLAAACLVTTGLLGRSWGYGVGHVLQIAAIALGFLVPIMFFIGGMFAVLWFGAYALGRKIASDKARWAAQEASGTDPL